MQLTSVDEAMSVVSQGCWLIGNLLQGRMVGGAEGDIWAVRGRTPVETDSYTKPTTNRAQTQANLE